MIRNLFEIFFSLCRIIDVDVKLLPMAYTASSVSNQRARPASCSQWCVKSRYPSATRLLGYMSGQNVSW